MMNTLFITHFLSLNSCRRAGEPSSLRRSGSGAEGSAHNMMKRLEELLLPESSGRTLTTDQIREVRLMECLSRAAVSLCGRLESLSKVCLKERNLHHHSSV